MWKFLSNVVVTVFFWKEARRKINILSFYVSSAFLLAGGFVAESKKTLEEGKFILLKGTASLFQEFLFMTDPFTPAKFYLSPLTSLPHTVKLHAFFFSLSLIFFF